MLELPGLAFATGPVTSAALDRYEACPGSAVFRPTGKEKVGFGAWHGIFVHRFLEYVHTKGEGGALAYIQSKRMQKTVAACVAIDLAALPDGIPEVGWAHNPVTDTAHQVASARALDSTTEQYGRADLLSLDARDRESFDGVDRPLITDWKTGDVDGSTHPDQNSQLCGLAASLRAEMGFAEIDVALARITSTGDIDWTISTLSKPHLDAYVARAGRVQLRVADDRARATQGIEPDFVRGPGCDWCKCRAVCPAWT